MLILELISLHRFTVCEPMPSIGIVCANYIYLYLQVDGVSMGSPLGVLFAQAYMCFVEGKVLEDDEVKPFMYYRYVDDIFLDFESDDKNGTPNQDSYR